MHNIGKVEKDKIWEGGIRIPQFIHWPNGNLPSSFDGMVSTIDIGPSMLDIANILSNPIDPNSLYEMDGKSWKDAVNSPEGEWDDRCLFFESSDDRAIRCGCDKYMLLSSDSPELSRALSNSWTGFSAGQAEALFNLCEAGSYISADPSKSSPESINISTEQPEKVASFQTLMQCHLARTDARNANVVTPDYDECVSAIATPSPTITPKPTLPVASNGGVPLVIDTSPWEDGEFNIIPHVSNVAYTTCI